MSEKEETCLNCLLSEISLRSGAFHDASEGGTFNKSRLWCWFNEVHVERDFSCHVWISKDTEGNPRQVAQRLRGDID